MGEEPGGASRRWSDANCFLRSGVLFVPTIFALLASALSFGPLPALADTQQPDASVNIPLFFSLNPENGQVKLGIYVGINGGDPKPYVFDTGSPVFNALYNPEWWPGYPPQPNSNLPPELDGFVDRRR